MNSKVTATVLALGLAATATAQYEPVINAVESQQILLSPARSERDRCMRSLHMRAIGVLFERLQQPMEFARKSVTPDGLPVVGRIVRRRAMGGCECLVEFGDVAAVISISKHAPSVLTEAH